MPPEYEIDGSTLRLRSRIDLHDDIELKSFREAIQSILQSSPAVLTLDFSPIGTTMLSSSIITLSFLAVDLAKATNVRVEILVSMRHHRALVGAGVVGLVDLRLCG